MSKRKPITIRAAYIGGVFVLLASLLGVVLPQSKHFLLSAFSPSPVKRAESIIKRHFGYARVALHPEEVVWCDLTSDGTNHEFYAKYEVAQVDHVVVFTVRHGAPENLFERNSIGGYELIPALLADAGKMFFVLASSVGSGGWMEIEVYAYDGIGKLRLLQKIGDLFQGDLWPIKNQVYLSGSNHKYELVRKGSAFCLEPYTERLRYISNSSIHVLAYHIKNGALTIFFDNDKMEFRQDSQQKHVFRSLQPIRIGINEQIVEDDNLVNVAPQEIRLLTTKDAFTSCPGFFWSLKPLKKGKTDINVSYNYDSWYIIEVVVE